MADKKMKSIGKNIDRKDVPFSIRCPEDFELLGGIIEEDGFEYGMTNYADEESIKDKHFHKLRKAFLLAREELQNYIEFDKMTLKRGSVNDL